MSHKYSSQIGRTESNKHINNTFDLLSRGEQEIVLRDEHKDIVLVFGNTGSGKSTFSQWITGRGNVLRAKETTKGTGEFVIEDDKNRIGNSTIQSKTIFPELFVDTKTNTAYYDCPGFSDTRSTSYDISSTFFMKKVLDHATRVKMIFIVNHHSLRKGVDRKDFLELLRHITDLIKNIDKFKHSIAIVATKVDNQYIEKGKTYVLVGDDKVITGIIDFLIEVRGDLEDRSKVKDVSAKEKKFYERAATFIDIFTLKDEANFSKIGIFRRPKKPGPLNDVGILREENEAIKNIIHDKLNFTIVSKDDFGYTISDKSKNDINSFKEEINRNIWTSVSQFAEKLENYYHALVNNIRSKITPPSSVSFDVSNRTEAETFSRNFKKSQNIALNMLKEFKVLTDPVELSEKINNTLIVLNVAIPQDIVTDIERKGRYFNFLQVVCYEELGTRPWADLFKGFPTYLSDSDRIILDAVNHVTVEIVEKIQSHLNLTERAIREHYTKKTKLLEIDKLPGIFDHDYAVLFNMTKKIPEQNTTIKLLKTIINDGVEKIHIDFPRKNIMEIVHLGQYFEYLQIISNQKVCIESFNKFHPFENTAKYVYDLNKWYTFLNDLYLKFSTYEIQKDRHKYNVANIEDFGIQGKKNGIYITEKNFRQFLQKLEPFNIQETAYIRNTEVSESRLEEINHVLTLTIKHKTVLSCSESNLCVIRGSYIRFNDVINLEIPPTVKSLYIYALNSIFIDTDLQVSFPVIKIISPKWEIIGSRKLELLGKNGYSHIEKQQLGSGLLEIYSNKGKLKAKDGSYPGERGDDGKPGGAGCPGPTFLGIGSIFVNGANLTIINKGGNGGSGEDGGDGYEGKKGLKVDEALIESSDDTYDTSHPIECVRYCKNFEGYNCITASEKIEWFFFEKCGMIIIGKPGGKGGDGGNGGKGGRGGPPGQIVLFELKEKSRVVKQFNNGQEGECGEGGLGGAGGYEGNSVVVRFDKFGLFFWEPPTKYIVERFTYQRGQSGKNGKDCFNARNIEAPKPPVPLESTKFLMEYKRFSRENMKDQYRRSSLRTFYSELENDNNVRNAYSVLDLLNEFQEIENQYNESNTFMDLIAIYESFLDRIIDRAKNLVVTEKSTIRRNELKKALTYLYVVILGKIYNLKENSQFDQIIDISRYLDLLRTDVQNLEDSQKVENKLNCVNRLKKNYKASIDNKIEEAKFLMENHVTPEINEISKQIDEQIDLLVLETIEIEKKTATQTEELIQKQQKLTEALELGVLFSGLKLMGSMLSFLGHMGEITGTVIGTTVAITESLTLNNNLDSGKILQLPASVISASKVLEGQIKTYTDKKISDLDRMIGDILLETQKHPEILFDISNKLYEIRERSKEIGKKQPKRAKLLQDELKRELKEKISKLKSHKASSNRKSKTALAVVEKFEKAVQLADVGIDIYNKYRNDESKLNVINEAIKQSENNFDKFKQFEEIIYNTLTPTLQNMENDLYIIANRLDKELRISLDITKWQVQSTLKNMKLLIKQLVQRFRGVEDKLPRCIEKLEESMTILIIVYDHIQNYKEQQNLANFITDISSPVAVSINMTNNQLINAISRLEVSLQSNIILQQYKVAHNAFKQFVFPFSQFYLEELNLPEKLMKVENVDNLIVQAVTKLEKMKSIIYLYETSANKYDKYVHRGEFSSTYVSSKPFFVWKNSKYRQSMSELLAGQEIVLKADIMLSPSDKDAIKSNFISFNFKTHNDTIQRELDNTLKAFQISATHLGNSYYQFDHQIYMIASSSQTFQYSFEMKSDRYPVAQNNVYDKIQEWDLMLSPYAFWKIKLINSTDNILFDKLKIYEDEIDLELVGSGSYLSKEARSLNLKMDDHYKAYETYNYFEVITGPQLMREEYFSNGRYVRSNSIVEQIEVVDYYTTSAGNTASGFSPINSICHFFKQSISKLSNACEEKFNNWFINQDERNYGKIIYDTSFMDNEAVSYEFADLNEDYTFPGTKCEIEAMATELIDTEYHHKNTMIYDMFDVQSNLLLLNLIFHKKNNSRLEKSFNFNSNDAHRLAYNAYTSNI